MHLKEEGGEGTSADKGTRGVHVDGASRERSRGGGRHSTNTQVSFGPRIFGDWLYGTTYPVPEA